MTATTRHPIHSASVTSRGRWLMSIGLLLVLTTAETLAHGVSPGDQALIQGGRQLAVFIYLGAKYMVTGYDHLL